MFETHYSDIASFKLGLQFKPPILPPTRPQISLQLGLQLGPQLGLQLELQLGLQLGPLSTTTYQTQDSQRPPPLTQGCNSKNNTNIIQLIRRPQETAYYKI